VLLQRPQSRDDRTNGPVEDAPESAREPLPPVAADGRLSDPTGPIAIEVADGAHPAGVAVLRVST
jgi:hypothetical protein